MQLAVGVFILWLCVTPVAVLAAGSDCTTLGLLKRASCPVYAVILSNRAAGPKPYSAAEVFAMAVDGPQLCLIAVYIITFHDMP